VPVSLKNINSAGEPSASLGHAPIDCRVFQCAATLRTARGVLQYSTEMVFQTRELDPVDTGVRSAKRLCHCHCRVSIHVDVLRLWQAAFDLVCVCVLAGRTPELFFNTSGDCP
jgi:hypothetical protein